MIGRMSRPAVAGLLALAVLTFLAAAASAQQPATAEITQMTKPVEVMRRGQTSWGGASTGMRLGDGDQMTPAPKAKALADRIAGSKTVVIKGCGHMMMTERPDETLAALKQVI